MRLSYPGVVRARSAYRRSTQLLPTLRAFATVPPQGKQSHGQRLPAVSGPEAVDNAKPESLEKKPVPEAIKTDPLLAEKTMSNKEQRKADWAIMKEMSRYLWPKVVSELCCYKGS
jgi:ABC transporter ATM